MSFTLPTGFSTYSIGLDRLLDDLNFFEEHLTRGDVKTAYPPHNLVKEDDAHYTLEVAVAGFDPQELSVEVEKNALTVRGTHTASQDGNRYIHRGIGLRNFTKSFLLGENVIINDASLENGLLRIHLTEVVPEKNRKRLVPITQPKALPA